MMKAFVGTRYIVPGTNAWLPAHHPPRSAGNAVILSEVSRAFSFARSARDTQSKDLSSIAMRLVLSAQYIFRAYAALTSDVQFGHRVALIGIAE
jgi:hypothetical protein